MRLLSCVVLTLVPSWVAAQMPGHPTYDSTLALFRSGKGDAAQAFAAAAVAARPGSCDTEMAGAVAANARGDHKAAVAAAEQCARREPGVAVHQLVLGQMLLAKAADQGGLGALGTAKKGRRALEQAVALDPDLLDAREGLVQFHVRAPGIAGGSKDEAARQAGEIARRDQWRGLRARLQVAAARKAEPEMVALFEEAFARVGTPADSTRQYTLMVAGSISLAPDPALQDRLADRAYRARPAEPAFQYQRARAWALQGQQLPEAERLLRAYIAAGPPPAHAASLGAAWWRLGLVLEKQGRTAEARDAYRQAVAVTSGDAARPMREDLKRLDKATR